MSDSTVHLFIGSINRTADTLTAGQGIAVMRFNEETLDLESLHVTDEIDNPSFLAVDRPNARLYAVSEVASWMEGTVTAFAIDVEAGSLTYLNKQPTLGRATCHVTVTGEGHVATANYSAGTGGPDRAMAVYAIAEDGRLSPPLASVAHEGTGPRTDRQDRSHAHSVQLTPDKRHLLVADLGTDELVAYRLEGTELKRAFAFKAQPGSGPRHFTFAKDGSVVYLMNEIACTVSVLQCSGDELTEIQTISTLPADYSEQSWGADIHLSPDGRYLYASTRVHDSVAVFAVGGDGTLSLKEIVPSGGKWPRSFAITPSGRHVLVANHNSDLIAIFARDAETGALTQTGKSIAIGTPMRIQAVSFA
ncbi:6-phosphogluconolactonase [Devosia pacifica]|uniref:6-phosphogluconolactonase n=1 Tax=Devosia pacifica TaxID=1335967 RepID=A0A918VY21_9HYPH|nr:lactonase family protein [Devosia pacifica]GHA34551.1 6-phosphogluconolactonase [Devosia pacifica]